MTTRKHAIEIDMHLKNAMRNTLAKDIPGILQETAAKLEEFLTENPEMTDLKVALPGLSISHTSNCFHAILRVELLNF